MKQRHLDEIRKIFPETPDHCDREGTGTFYAFNKQLLFSHFNGVYSLLRWSHEFDYAHSRNFKVFLKKLEKVRKDFELDKFLRDMTANMMIKRLESEKFLVENVTESDSDSIELKATGLKLPASYDEFSLRIGSDFIDAYYGVSRIYFMCGKPQYTINGAFEAIMKTARRKKLV